MAIITQSRPPVFGEDHSYSLKPPPGPGCKVTWFIDGQEVTVGSEVGGLKVEGINGTMSVEVVGDIKKGMKVSAKIKCPDSSYEAGPINVGGEVDRTSLIDIILEILRSFYLIITLPLWIIWKLLYLLAILLNTDNPDPKKLKKQLREITKNFPKWLKKLLGIH